VPVVANTWTPDLQAGIQRNRVDSFVLKHIRLVALTIALAAGEEPFAGPSVRTAHKALDCLLSGELLLATSHARRALVHARMNKCDSECELLHQFEILCRVFHIAEDWQSVLDVGRLCLPRDGTDRPCDALAVAKITVACSRALYAVGKAEEGRKAIEDLVESQASAEYPSLTAFIEATCELARLDFVEERPDEALSKLSGIQALLRERGLEEPSELCRLECLKEIAKCGQGLADASASEVTFIDAVDLHRARSVDDAEWLIDVYSALVDIYTIQGRIGDLQTILYDRYQLATRLYGPKTPATIEYGADLATTLCFAQLYDEATSILEAIGFARRDIERFELETQASMLASIGNVEACVGRTRLARIHCEAAVALLYATDDETAILPLTLATLGRIAESDGNIAKADASFEKALELIDQSSMRYIDSAGLICQMFAEVLCSRGAYSRAESLVIRGMEFDSSLYALDHPYMGEYYGLLSRIRGAINDNYGAIGYARQALDNKEKCFAPDSVSVCFARMRMASLLIAVGRPREAQPLVHSVLASIQPSTTHMASCYCFAVALLAWCLAEQGYYSEAMDVSVWSKSEIELKGRLQCEMPWAIGANSAIYAREHGDWDSVRSWIGSAGGCNDCNDKDVSIGNWSKCILAAIGICYDLGYTREVLRLVSDVGKSVRDEDRVRVPASDFYDRVRGFVDILDIALAYVMGGTASVESIESVFVEYHNLREIAWKLKRSLAVTSRGAEVGSERGAIVQEWEKVVRSLSDYVVDRSPGSSVISDPGSALWRYEYLERDALDSQSEELQSCASLIDCVREGLDSRACFVSLYSYWPYVPSQVADGRVLRGGCWRDARTMAWVVGGDTGVIKAIDLGDSSLLYQPWRDVVGSLDHAWPVANSSAWWPLLDQIGAYERVVVAHDARIADVPLGVMRYSNGDYVCERQETIYVESLSPLNGWMERRSNVPRSLCVVGAVEYGDWSPPQGSMTRWEDLEWSVAELNQITGVFVASGGGGVNSSVRRVSGGRSDERFTAASFENSEWIHIATHGFVIASGLGLSEDDALRWERRSEPVKSDVEVILSRVPELGVGIVLGGANRGVRPDGTDGYLTGEEIVGIDLSGCECVVLSSCESSIGRRVSGVSMLGLARSFLLAGAKRVVSTVCRVSDRGSAEFMGEFYSCVWGGEVTVSAALRSAQVEMLRRAREAGHVDGSPLSWGGYIVTVR